MSRYRTLDAMRGLAALLVMLWHTPGSWWAGRSGYLGVDLFFMISGFVIAGSYQPRLAGGMTVNAFMMLRIIRLWPCLALGAALGIGIAGGHLGMLVLVPGLDFDRLLYPANPPLWSLAMEMIAYLAFGLALVRMRSSALVCLALAAGAFLLAEVLTSAYGPDDFGAAWATLPGGLARLFWAFIVGILMCRARQTTPLPRSPSRSGWYVCAALGMLLIAIPRGNEAGAALAMLVAIPALVWLASGLELANSRLVDALRDLSYPLYCIHVPLLFWGQQHGIAGPALWLPLVLASLAVDRWWDRPVRSHLLARWTERERRRQVGQPRAAPSV